VKRKYGYIKKLVTHLSMTCEEHGTTKKARPWISETITEKMGQWEGEDEVKLVEQVLPLTQPRPSLTQPRPSPHKHAL